MATRRLKIALVTDWLTDLGGAECVLLALSEMYPDAPIFTTLYRPERVPQFAKADVRTSYLQSIPFARDRHRLMLPFMPAAVESFDLDGYDVVISSTSSGCAKGIITKPTTLHLCYCHNPSRVLWDGCHEYERLHERHFSWPARLLIPGQLKKMRIWDRIAADRVDAFVANSAFVAKRIQKYYQRTSTVVHPPVATNDFVASDKRSDYFLAVGRLIPYKRFDLVVQAANVLGAKVRIVGQGPEEKFLRSIAGPTVSFVGPVSNEQLRRMYAECKALIFPQVEDFGLTAIEVQAAGRPVVALKSGGALETVVSNRTGIFFAEQTVSSLAIAMQRAEKTRWLTKVIQKNAQRFDINHFKQHMDAVIQEQWYEFSRK